MCNLHSCPGNDYNASSIPSTIVIPSGLMEGCFDVDIIDDNVNEPQEDFEISARLQGSVIPDAMTAVTIIDDDGKMTFYDYFPKAY